LPINNCPMLLVDSALMTLMADFSLFSASTVC
jgi:hypothetical protein